MSFARPRRSDGRGFSLVEVVLAMGLMVFVLTAILGLLPSVLKNNKVTVEESRAINILTSVTQDLKATPATSTVSSIYAINPSPGVATTNATASLYFSEAQEIVPSAAVARYKVSIKYQVPAVGSKQPVGVALRIAWPAQTTSATQESFVETFFSLPNQSF